MAEAISFEQPRIIEEDSFPAYETPYDEFATFEVAGDAYGDDDPGRLTQLFQAYGRKAGALVLAGTAIFGLEACDPGSQTTSVGGNRPERVLEISRGSVTTGKCVMESQKSQDINGNPTTRTYPNCAPGISALRNESAANVRKAGNVTTYNVAATEDSCDGPGPKFVSKLRNGDIMEVSHKRHVDYSVKPNKVTSYCEWDEK